MRWLHLSQMPSVGPRTFFGLLKKFGNSEEALRRLPELSKPSGGPPPVPTFSSISGVYEAYGKAGARLIAYPEPLYPELLRHIPDPPPLISVFGDISLLSRPMIAIVGARNGSASGKLLAERFAKCLSEAGFIIVSGLARGIDTSVHQGALKGGRQPFLPGGLIRLILQRTGSSMNRSSKQASSSLKPPWDVRRGQSFFPAVIALSLA